MTMETITNTEKIKKSMERCEKKVSKPFNPKFFSENFNDDSFNLFTELTVTIKFRIMR